MSRGIKFTVKMNKIDKYHDSVIQFQDALSDVQKIVNVRINSAQLSVLKNANYSLCFAKEVNQSYNVIWQSIVGFLSRNRFSWSPQYEIFGSNQFTGGVQVVTSTNVEPIGLGYSCTLNSDGIIEPKESGDSETSLELKNEYGPIHPGVNQVIRGVDGKLISLPIYVAENEAVKGTVFLTPVERVRVWFEQEVQTSSMISTAFSKYIEVDMTEKNEATVEYNEMGEWRLI